MDCWPQDQPPNVIFILVDDMGYYDLSSYGVTEVKTTQTDKLAENGILIADFYAGSSRCTPSLSGLLKGINSLWDIIKVNYSGDLKTIKNKC